MCTRPMLLVVVALAGCALAHERGGTGPSTCDGLVGPAHPLGPPAVHRPAASACPGARGPIAAMPACDTASDPSCAMARCVVDADCTEGTNGRCSHLHHGTAADRQYCSYDECASDAACGAGVCRCRPDADSSVANRCFDDGNCRTDADCGPGGFCSPSLVDAGFCACPTEDLCVDAGDGTGCFVSYDGGPPIAVHCLCGNTCAAPGWYCHTPCDQCASDDDCALGTRCVFDVRETRWACRDVLCTSGP